jgi:2-polyprenyl-3-methyl-5-hydroxy-6-metoxy-1,4-benzoquinol methylase
MGSADLKPAPGGRVNYLTPARTVAMHNEYFFNANIDHFWISRRFLVARRLADQELTSAARIAEFGCGNGVLQRQMELRYGHSVDGFDLNDFALQSNISRSSGVYCYDIHARRPEYREYYDLILLFDVLEHIEDEGGFLESLLFHLRPSGSVLINVPAGQYLYSRYDKAQGHCRRYSAAYLRRVVESSGLRVEACTYWGVPMVPLLLLRRILSYRQSDQEAMQKGFRPPSDTANTLLGLLSRCEPVPHGVAGTSVMMLARKGA